jgi:beta-glucosidase/6-phospho-beta-glucosidase/beta-galactosidase/ABC-type amino acid transport substrate-binding protein
MEQKTFWFGWRKSQPLRPFPANFFFGVDTSDHQCEAYREDLPDVWDVWETQQGLTRRGRATDFEAHFPEDIERARLLGCRAFRFSIAWSRVQTGPDTFQPAAFEYYQRVIDAIRKAGMQPVLTLMHFIWPLWVADAGGLIDDRFPEIFCKYVAAVVERFGTQVPIWVTINEPSQLVFGYIKTWWQAKYPMPPGWPAGTPLETQIEGVGKLMRNLFLAHTQARQIIRAANPQAMVTANPLALGLPPLLQRWLDYNASRIRTFEDFMRHGKRAAERGLLSLGKVDLVLAALTQTADRDEQVLFSDVYFIAGQALLVQAGSPAARAADLEGKAVAVMKGTTAADRAAELLPRVTPLPASDYPSALSWLSSGQAAALLADDVILAGLMQTHPGEFRMLPDRLSVEPYAAAVAPGNNDLLAVVNQALRDFKASGGWKASSASLASELTLAIPEGKPDSLEETRRPVGKKPDVVKLDGILTRIRGRGILKAAVKEDVPGLGYRDPRTSQWSGLEIDLAREVAQRIFGDEGRVEFISVKASKRIGLLGLAMKWINPLLKDISILSSILFASWWQLGMAGRLPEFLCPLECRGQQDLIGLDYYWGTRNLTLHRISQLVSAAGGKFDLSPVWPGALYDLLTYYARMMPGLPLLVVENGSVDVADDIKREDYLRRHIAAVQRAVQEGLNVIGYMCWSITTNREWGNPLSPSCDFGLYQIDLDHDSSLTRHETSAAMVYRQVIADGGVKHVT